MNLEKFLHFVTYHSESIIQWVFFAILILTGSLVGLVLFRRKMDSDLVPALGGDLNATLSTIMERTAKLEAISLGDASPAVLQKVNAEIEMLKKTLQSKDAEILQMKSSGNGKPGEAAVDLQNRITELEAKLAEYEILEDDIADLSLYKDENAKLRREIEKYKAGGVAEAPAPAAPAAAPAPAPVEAASPQDSADSIVAEFAQAVVEAPAAAAPTAAAPIAAPDTGNPMADFESSLKALPSEPAEPTLPNEKDDLFAEFAVGEAPAEGEAAPAAGLDTDKVLTEMANLTTGEAAGSSLEDSVDTDKMVLEVTGLENKS